MPKRVLSWRCLKWVVLTSYKTGVKEACETIVDIAEKLGISEFNRALLELVVDEAVTNALEAELNLALLGEGAKDKIRLSDCLNMQQLLPVPACKLAIWVKDNKLRIEILDKGPGFIPKEQDIDLWSDRGRGCIIMRSYTDRVVWKRRPEGGTRCILVKKY